MNTRSACLNGSGQHSFESGQVELLRRIQSAGTRNRMIALRREQSVGGDNVLGRLVQVLVQRSMPDDQVVTVRIELVRVDTCWTRRAGPGLVGEDVVAQTLRCQNVVGCGRQPYPIGPGSCC